MLFSSDIFSDASGSFRVWSSLYKMVTIEKKYWFLKVIIMDLIYMGLFKARKALHIEPIIHSHHFHTGGC